MFSTAKIHWVSKEIGLLANSSTEYYSCNSFKKMNPFPSLVSLASNIEKSINFTTLSALSHRAADEPFIWVNNFESTSIDGLINKQREIIKILNLMKCHFFLSACNYNGAHLMVPIMRWDMNQRLTTRWPQLNDSSYPVWGCK